MKKKTTLYMDEATYARLKAIARGSKRSPAELVREAVAEYTVKYARRRGPSSIGAFRSGRRDLGVNAEKLLKGFGAD